MVKKEIYKGEFWNEKMENFSRLFGLPRINGLLDFIYTRASILRVKDQEKWVLSTYKPERILEIGCGYGGGIIYWHRKGYDINGLEPDKRLVERVNRKVGKNLVFLSTIEKFKAHKYYDLVILSHVLEHIPSLQSFFQKINRMQKKGGAIFVEVPNCENKAVLSESKNNKAHLHHFTTKSLQNAFRTHGYRVLKLERLVSKLDLVTVNGLSKFQRFARLVQVIFAKDKSTRASAKEANIIRLIAVKE